MSLPLLDLRTEDRANFLFVSPKPRPSARRPSVADLVPVPRGDRSDLGVIDGHLDHPAARSRMPERALEAGEQYRFHFDMASCIGCKCCVVACNEQNGNPADINWRRVGEVEGGWYPDAQRSYLSMGCNHCLEPTCLAGCPVDAYDKDPVTGIVRHSADTCIGCQYCTWNCSYGVPQFNAERGVVGKCDMCHGRLSAGEAPACVSACPEGAIAIEIVGVADWRARVSAAEAGVERMAGVPSADGSLSTTRVTMPADLAPDTRPRDLFHVKPNDPHWPLVIMTVLTQLSVGAFASIWFAQMFGAATRLGVAAVSSFAIAALALGASTMHLGRPIHAYRALKMWKRSWLSREVLLFTLFAGVANAYAAALWLDLPGSRVFGAITLVAGAAGVVASACIYRVPARPAWNSRLTMLRFGMTACVLGPLFVAAMGISGGSWLRLTAAVMAGLELVLIAVTFLRFIASDSIELRGTARLLSTTLAQAFLLRGLLLVVGGVMLPLLGSDWRVSIAAAALTLAGELTGRYLFFVSVVPKHMTTAYLPMGSEAAA